MEARQQRQRRQINQKIQIIMCKWQLGSKKTAGKVNDMKGEDGDAMKNQKEMACVLIPPRVIDKRLPGTSAIYIINKRYASQKCNDQEKEEKLADRSMRSTRRTGTRIELQFFTSSVIECVRSSPPLACNSTFRSPLCLLWRKYAHNNFSFPIRSSNKVVAWLVLAPCEHLCWSYSSFSLLPEGFMQQQQQQHQLKKKHKNSRYHSQLKSLERRRN